MYPSPCPKRSAPTHHPAPGTRGAGLSSACRLQLHNAPQKWQSASGRRRFSPPAPDLRSPPVAPSRSGGTPARALKRRSSLRNTLPLFEARLAHPVPGNSVTKFPPPQKTKQNAPRFLRKTASRLGTAGGELTEAATPLPEGRKGRERRGRQLQRARCFTRKFRGAPMESLQARIGFQSGIYVTLGQGIRVVEGGEEATTTTYLLLHHIIFEDSL